MDNIVQIRREKKNFVVEGKTPTQKSVREKIKSELQGLIDAVKWPQECANCGRPVQKTDTLILSSSIKGTGAVAVSVKGIPYCEDCFPKIKRSQNIAFAQLVVTALVGIVLTILLIIWQFNSDSPVVVCGGAALLSFAVGYGLSWLFVKLPAKIFMKDKIAEPVTGNLKEQQKGGGKKVVSVVLSIPNEGYAAKFAQLNGVL